MPLNHGKPTQKKAAIPSSSVVRAPALHNHRARWYHSASCTPSDYMAVRTLQYYSAMPLAPLDRALHTQYVNAQAALFSSFCPSVGTPPAWTVHGSVTDTWRLNFMLLARCAAANRDQSGRLAHDDVSTFTTCSGLKDAIISAMGGW